MKNCFFCLRFHKNLTTKLLDTKFHHFLLIYMCVSQKWMPDIGGLSKISVSAAQNAKEKQYSVLSVFDVLSNLFKWPPLWELSSARQSLIQLLLYKMATCLILTATTFVSQMKKNSKTTTTKLYPAKKWEKNIRQQWKKTLWLYLF